MSIVKKLGLGLLAIVLLLLAAAAIALIVTARSPARPVGAQQLLNLRNNLPGTVAEHHACRVIRNAGGIQTG